MADSDNQLLVPLLRQRLLLRTCWACVAFILPTILGTMAHSRNSWLDLLSISLPYVLILPVAALAPRGLPASDGLNLVISMILMILSASDVKRGLAWWFHTNHEREVRATRAFVAWTWALGVGWLAFILWHQRGADFWRRLRAVLTVSTGLRLAATLLLQQLGASPGCYPPAHLDFEGAIAFNVACMMLTTVGLSSPARRLLSEWTGGDRVVLKLAEVPCLTGSPSEGVHDQISVSRHTWTNATDQTGYTQSVCSTFLAEEDRLNDPLAPLNTLDAHPEHSSL